jgi:hypothetical protein
MEKIFPYPWMVEELFKLVIVWLILKSKPGKKYLFLAIFAGLLFAFSETIFYLTNIFALGNLAIIPKRIFFTSALHLGTILLMAIFGKRSGRWWIVGFLGAVLAHNIYNELIGNIFVSFY